MTRGSTSVTRATSRSTSRAPRYVELPGSDHRPWLGDVDAIADEIEVFLTGRKSRPRRRTTIGVDALSRREREVALLASRGETATEIASAAVREQAHGREPPGQRLRQARRRFEDRADPPGRRVRDLAGSPVSIRRYLGRALPRLISTDLRGDAVSRTSRRAVPTWSTWRELLSVIAYPTHLKRTATIALIVGTVFFTMNQLGPCSRGTRRHSSGSRLP